MKRFLQLAWRPALLAAGLLGAGILLREAGVADLGAAGRHGVLFTVLLGAASCAVGLPRQAVAYAAGLAWGFWPGASLALAAQVIGCAATLLWSRLVARRWVEARLRRRSAGRLARLDGYLARNPFTATLTLRLLPAGSNILLNLIAGASGVPAAPFLLASALGYVPQTVIFALLGSGVRIEHGSRVVVAGALFALSLLLGTILIRRGRVPAPG